MRRFLFASLLALAGLAVSADRASAWWYYPAQPGTVSFPMVYPSGYYTNTYPFAWYYPWYANYNYSHGSYAHWWQSHGWAFYPGQPIPANFRIHPIHGAYFIYIVPQFGPPHMHPAHHDHHDHHHHPLPAPKKDAPKKKEPGKVTITLPADAKLTFNGVAASGTGDSRTYVTPDLDSDRDYEYVLAAEVIRNGQTLTATQRAIVRAGSDTRVSLEPAAVVRK